MLRSWLEGRLAALVASELQPERQLERLLAPDTDGPVRVQLRGGAVVRCAAVVGADGPQSAVRAQLLPQASTRFLGYAVIASPPLPQDTLLRLPGRVCTWLAQLPEQLTAVPETAAHFRWYFAFRIDEDRLAQLRELGPLCQLEFVRKRVASWDTPLQPLVDAVTSRAGEVQLRAAFQHVPGHLAPLCSAPFERDGHQVDRPRVALVGDAAQMLPPLMGEGANAALEDAAETAALLARSHADSHTHPWADAIAAANRGVVERAVPNLRQCGYGASSLLPQKPIHAMVRNSTLPILGRLSFMKLL